MTKFKTKILILILITLLVAAVTYRYVVNKKNVVEITETQKIQFVEAVSVSEYKLNNKIVQASGVVESMEQVDIKSQLAAEIIKVNVDIGQEVKQGDLLIELDHASMDAQLSQAAASISRAQSGFDQIVAGATDQDVERVKNVVMQAEATLEQTKATTQAAIDNAQKSVEMMKKALDNTDQVTEQAINDSYNNLRLAINSTMPNILSILVSTGDILGEEPGSKFINNQYESLLGVKKTGIKDVAILSFKNSYTKYVDLKIEAEKITATSDRAKIDIVANSLKTVLNNMASMLVKTREMLDNSVTSASFSEANLNALKGQVDGAITSVNSLAQNLERALQAVNNTKLSKSTNKDTNQLNYERALESLSQAQNQAKSAINAAESALAIQKASYDAITAGPRDVDLGSVKSSIREAQAAYQLIKSNRDKAFIYAPFDGTVSSLSIGEHDLVSPGAMLVSLVNMKGLQITTFVAEKDRQLISVGNKVLISDYAEGVVTNISPSIDSFTKKVEVIAAVTTENSKITIGQNIDLQILTDNMAVEDVYVVPLKSIIINQNSIIAYVLVEENGAKKAREKNIKVGQIEGLMIEVIDGLHDDDLLIIEGSKEIGDGQSVKTE